MATAAILPAAVKVAAAPPEIESFSVEDLYQLQKRRGKLAEPKVSYAQRNALKAKFRTEPAICGSMRHSLFIWVQDVCSVFNAFVSAPTESSSWLGYWLWGHHFRGTDIKSGRSRFAQFRPSAPLELTKKIYDPYQVDRF